LEGDALVDFAGELIEFSGERGERIEINQASDLSASKPETSFLQGTTSKVKEVSHVAGVESTRRLSDVRAD
jgi:hypothetical protein